MIQNFNFSLYQLHYYFQQQAQYQSSAVQCIVNRKTKEKETTYLAKKIAAYYIKNPQGPQLFLQPITLMRINHDLLFLDKERLDPNGKLVGQAELFKKFKTINSCTFNKESQFVEIEFINNNEIYYPIELLTDRLKSIGDINANNLANLLLKFEENMQNFYKSRSQLNEARKQMGVQINNEKEEETYEKFQVFLNIFFLLLVLARDIIMKEKIFKANYIMRPLQIK